MAILTSVARAFLARLLLAIFLSTGALAAVSGNAQAQQLELPAAIMLTPGVLPDAVAGTFYNQQLTPSGGVPQYVFAQMPPQGTETGLPPGITVSAGGLISGTTTIAGDYEFRISVTDSAAVPETLIRPYRMRVTGTVTITVLPPTLPDGVVGTAYAQQLSATGGAAPYSFDLVGGQGGTGLPPGLTMNGAGLISGTPTTTGTFTFTARATDSQGNIGTRLYTVSITDTPAAITVLPPVLPDGEVGVFYSRQLRAIGGRAPYAFAVTDGSIPPGLDLPAAGRLAGTPTRTGTYSFTVTATDADGLTGQRAYEVRIGASSVDDLVVEVHRQARRFARDQVGNISARLEDLRGGACEPLAGDIAVVFGGETLPMPETGAAACEGWPWSLWVRGRLAFSERGPAAGSPSVDFTTAGLTAGIDHRFHPQAVAGFAIGFGLDNADVPAARLDSDGTSVSAALYGSFEPVDDLFVDAIAGVARLDFDTRRQVAATGTDAVDNRDATQMFGSLGAAWRTTLRHRLIVDAHGRLEASATHFERSSETGAGAFNATYLGETSTGLDGVLGLSLRYPVETGWGWVTPHGSLEYRRAFLNGFDQTFFFAGSPGRLIEIDGDLGPRDSVSGLLGVDFSRGDGLSLGLDVGASLGSDDYRSLGVGGRMTIRF